MNNILEIRNLDKNIYNFSLKSINIYLRKGEILGVVGKNGSGKTTLAKLILNFYRPKRGEINVFGLDSIRDSKEIKLGTGVIPQSLWFDNNMRPAALLKRTLKSRNQKNDGEIDFLVDYFDMNMSGKIGNLSPLDKRKLSIINGLVADSPLIIVDEPDAIPDPLTRIKLYDILEEKNREGASILIFTSNLKEAQSICDNIYYLNNGEIIDQEDQSHKLSNDKILKYYDKDIDTRIFENIGAKLVQTGDETIFYYSKGLDILAEAIYKTGLIDYTVEDSTLDEKLTILEKGKLFDNREEKVKERVTTKEVTITETKTEDIDSNKEKFKKISSEDDDLQETRILGKAIESKNVNKIDDELIDEDLAQTSKIDRSLLSKYEEEVIKSENNINEELEEVENESIDK